MGDYGTGIVLLVVFFFIFSWGLLEYMYATQRHQARRNETSKSTQAKSDE